MADLGQQGRIPAPWRRQIGEKLICHRILGLLRAQPVQRRASSDTARPGLKSAFRFESVTRAINAPEGLNREFVRCPRIANDAQNPPAHGALMETKERLECRLASLRAAPSELD